ncbi:DEAD/DEAH box helicase [Sulfidibacter corallicola]|uniref:DEAD/DEAH box helicase n=1 Tax=Sulfidibacter corallicola TaxID=2818388 RepID=A0A8A4TNF5_SULCO|nr:DEAD/DEAH box helicase [Sulfidibacter corallicola]QTD50421.1 DEAD/DEAH box helicase [Sulfidibacter corallicola]
MIDSPIQIARDLKNIYLKYLKSSFPLRHPLLERERHTLLAETGVLAQPPMMEPIKKYQGDTTLTEMGSLYRDLDGLTRQGLFWNESGQPRALFPHQVRALKAVVEEKKHMVVTTGTGSGKTECLFLPILQHLLAEKRGEDLRKERHQPAVRALFLYPLNALAEDQMVRLRKALNTQAVRHWLDFHMEPNFRIRFGRYIGQTPVSGDRSETKKSELRKARKKEQTDRQKLSAFKDKDLYRFEALSLRSCDLDPGSAELFSRWDMQDRPPDLLITNHSMLNIMLMRAIEADSIIAKTRDWLAGDRSRLFHLVIDELHMHRGTPGSEVAYLLRLLLHRLGLQPNSPQIRILASSASLVESDLECRQYINEMFALGLDATDREAFVQKVCLIGDEATTFSGTPQPFTRQQALAFQSLAAVSEGSQTVNEFLKRVSQNSRDADSKIENMATAIRHWKVPQHFLQLCQKGPTTLENIAAKLFGPLKLNDALLAAEGFVNSLLLSKDDKDKFQTNLMPLRFHLFFRSLNGLWACTNPNCDLVVDPLQGQRPFGKLYTKPRMVCGCGSRVLDVLTCRSCGEVFLGGYKYQEGEQADPCLERSYKLVHDQPNYERAQPLSGFQRAYASYAVFWPSQKPPHKKTWKRRSRKHSWERSSLLPRNGALEIGLKNGPNLDWQSGWAFQIDEINKPDPDGNVAPPSAFPACCPNCEEQWIPPRLQKDRPWQQDPSPIGFHFTPAQRLNQILADELLRHWGENRKLITFTDSRQEAAKLSAGLEQFHAWDLVRHFLVRSLDQVTSEFDAFLKYFELGPRALNTQEKQHYRNYQRHNPNNALLLRDYFEEMLEPGSKEERNAKELISKSQGPFAMGPISQMVGSKLLALGICPGGPKSSFAEHKWWELYQFEVDSVHKRDDLTPQQKILSDNISKTLLEECVKTLFDQKRRSWEMLGLGRVTIDPQLLQMFNPSGLEIVKWRGLIDLAIRILGEHRRILFSTIEKYPQTGFLREAFPKRVKHIIRSLEKENGLVNLADTLRSFMATHGLIDNREILLKPQNLFLIPAVPNQQTWLCANCHTLHLVRDLAWCSNCLQMLPEQGQKLGNLLAEQDDYYRYLAYAQQNPFRLHCEELTGQTDKADTLDRQRWFQNLSLNDRHEPSQVFDIDLLSVTTTMEAGVDIGGLKGVHLANMPPRRFNYQQRVGRAGRRGSAYSLALVVARGRTHDEFHYAQPRNMTAMKPRSPYLDMKRHQILRRVLVKEILFQASRDAGFSKSIGYFEPPHGSFGNANHWRSHFREIVEYYLKNQRSEMEQIFTALAPYPEPSIDRDTILEDILANLLADIDRVADDDNRYPQEQLSERLANAGILPMFGFPTRTRRLYTNRPVSSLDQHAIDRPMEMAIVEFAPGRQLVKDKAVYTAVGLAAYERSFRGICEKGGVPGLIQLLSDCPACRYVFITETSQLPYGFKVEPNRKSLEPPFGFCPNCNYAQLIQAKSIQPAGFVSEPGTQLDYDAKLDFFPGSAELRISGNSCSELLPDRIQNLNIRSEEGQAVVTSLDTSLEFKFKTLKKQNIWVAVDFLTPQSIWRDQIPEKDEGTALRLAAVHSTDTLLLHFHRIPKTLDLTLVGPKSTLAAHAAFQSWGDLICRVAGKFLDVDPSEITANYRAIKHQGIMTGEIGLADTLENGAGYCPHLHRHLHEALIEPLQPGKEQYQTLLVGSGLAISGRSGGHASQCKGSCYDCLRGYDNIRHHPILDWRLAIDLAHLANDRKAAIDLAQPHWEGMDELAAKSIAAVDPDWKAEKAGSVWIVNTGNRERGPFLPKHPLWSEYHQQLIDWKKEFGLRSNFFSIFEALRRPGREGLRLQ